MRRAVFPLAALAAGLALAACVTVPSEPPADDACNASKVAPWIGKAATPAVRADIARATGAKAIRWLYPDSVVTMDYSPGRLNVTMDKGTDVIRSARCG
jgi:hypothetical protein